MFARLHSHLSYANVVATLALVLALGGSAYAATQVGSHEVKNRSLRGIDVKKNALTGKEIKEEKLGVVPSAGQASNATTLNGLSSGLFERASRTQVTRVTPAAAPNSPVVLEWGAFGVRIAAPNQGGCSPATRVTLTLTNTSSASGDLAIYGGASGSTTLGPGESSTACSLDSLYWDGVVVRAGDSRTFFFRCERVGAEVACVGTRSEP